jgi:hypothetical protein
MAAPVEVTNTPTQVVVSWTRLTADADIGWDPITNYRLEKSQSPSSGFWTVCTTGPSDSSCTESFTMPANTVYYYRVISSNSIGWSAAYSANL